MIKFTDEELLAAWVEYGQSPDSPDFPKFCEGARRIKRRPHVPTDEEVEKSAQGSEWLRRQRE